MARAPLRCWLILAATLPLSGCVGFFRWVGTVVEPETPGEQQQQGPRNRPDTAEPGDSGSLDTGTWWEF